MGAIGPKKMSRYLICGTERSSHMSERNCTPNILNEGIEEACGSTRRDKKMIACGEKMKGQ